MEVRAATELHPGTAAAHGSEEASEPVSPEMAAEVLRTAVRTHAGLTSVRSKEILDFVRSER